MIKKKNTENEKTELKHVTGTEREKKTFRGLRQGKRRFHR